MRWSPPTSAEPAPALTLRLRTLRFEDVPDVLRLVGRAVEYGCGHHYDPMQRRAVTASYAGSLFVEALGPFDTVVAEEHGRIVGVAQADHADHRLRALFVDAFIQQRGVGRALLTHIEERARARGSHRLHGAMALNAVPFYLKAGFRPCGGPECLTSTPIQVPVLRMEKELWR